MWLSGDGPPHNRRLQSIVAGTTQRSVHFSLCSLPVGMNKRCLWTSATLRLSDHAGLTLRKLGVCLIPFVRVRVYRCAVHFGPPGDKVSVKTYIFISCQLLLNLPSNLLFHVSSMPDAVEHCWSTMWCRWNITATISWIILAFPFVPPVG